MTFGSRQKGSVAEREVAAMLQLWWLPVEASAQFCRTPSSGGWATPELRSGFGAAGDLMTTAKRFCFAVEVKRREGWVLNNILLGRASPVWKWWWQCQDAAREMKKEPMLWLRRSREPWYVMLSEQFVGRCAVRQALGAAAKVWTPAELRGINTVVHPVLFVQHAFLRLSPMLFTKAA
jgi:hypothetical protein